ncbi:hypothetical protein OG568_60560 (plasmid) [Streptomyces sp. NBC_01450]|uniref:hypothetical protein n=1 Tax=Streptomyces sp. NBC_01450 TaxID=2903871 RepID=UPI002E334660|nr:hypothetical protein [Streptomyces sp. NBC_01450]
MLRAASGTGDTTVLSITDRERDIPRMLSNGLETPQIARKLNYLDRTQRTSRTARSPDSASATAPMPSRASSVPGLLRPRLKTHRRQADAPAAPSPSWVSASLGELDHTAST